MDEIIAKEIILMNKECEELTAKYGTESSIVKKLSYRIKLFAEYYDEVQQVKHLNTLLQVNYASSQMLRAKKKGWSYEEQAKLNGWDSEKWKSLDSIDETIEYAKKIMDEIN